MNNSSPIHGGQRSTGKRGPGGIEDTNPPLWGKTNGTVLSTPTVLIPKPKVWVLAVKPTGFCKRHEPAALLHVGYRLNWTKNSVNQRFTPTSLMVEGLPPVDKGTDLGIELQTFGLDMGAKPQAALRNVNRWGHQPKVLVVSQSIPPKPKSQWAGPMTMTVIKKNQVTQTFVGANMQRQSLRPQLSGPPPLHL